MIQLTSSRAETRARSFSRIDSAAPLCRRSIRFSIRRETKRIPEEARCANSRASNDAINADRNHERRAEIKAAGDLSLNLYRTCEEERSLEAWCDVNASTRGYGEIGG